MEKCSKTGKASREGGRGEDWRGARALKRIRVRKAGVKGANMQPPNRNGRGGGNPRPMGGGFPAFPDPFAGFGGLGGRPGGLLSDMFDNDPFFRDPFFSRTFAAPFGAGIFGPTGIFNAGIFGMGPQPMQQGPANFLEDRSYASRSVSAMVLFTFSAVLLQFFKGGLLGLAIVRSFTSKCFCRRSARCCNTKFWGFCCPLRTICSKWSVASRF